VGLQPGGSCRPGLRGSFAALAEGIRRQEFTGNYITRGRITSSSDMESTAVIWETLARSRREIVTSGEVAALARRLGRRPDYALRHLRRTGYLLPLFRGYYYVRGPEELRLGDTRHNPLELFAMAAERKGIGTWYYGLYSALRLNGMTHEERRDEAVISDSFYRIRGVPIGGKRFVVYKWRPELVTFGLVTKGPYRYSDPEKTVLDFAYWDHWRVSKGRSMTRVWAEHAASVEKNKMRRYLRHYPPAVSHLVEAVR